ncbi:MAG: hypothetical protein R2879_03910 [Saprospiraceae bacterium]
MFALASRMDYDKEIQEDATFNYAKLMKQNLTPEVLAALQVIKLNQIIMQKPRS